MKMNYVLKSSRNTKNPAVMPIKIAGTLLVLLGIIYAVFPQMLPYIATSLVRPFWNIEQKVRGENISIEELRKTYDELSSASAKNDAVISENEDLKSLLGRSAVPRPLLATILKKPPFSAYDTLILDVGVAEHVQKGNKVYALGNIPVGEIAEVIGETSKALLYTSAGEKFTIAIGTSSITTTATGKGGGYFEASLPRDTKIVAGDKVLIPALSNSFVGTVEALASEPSEPFSRILFRQPVNIYEQKWVLVDTHENK